MEGFIYAGPSGLGLILSMVIAAAASYFLGCFNGAVIVSKYILRDDVRNHGSGNAGLTNFHRTFGGGLTFVVILCDVLKAVIAVLLGSWLFAWDPLLGKYFAALFCLLGHMFPCMFHFKGGKGILSGGTIALMIDWRVALVVWGGFLILVIVTRYVSLGSLWAGASFPFISWYCYPEIRIVVLAFLLGGLVVWQHRGNAQRLIHGKERKLSFHKEKEGGS
ncbi:glycerol-3-phosphate 1-O-acyltransferase PlsY [uncultured Oscillibacter sp.]|uniref:glycerol-3-phosphate 1-O-acyltransferase PlsY n=1 Tax=uncultured Oscillibacter sp. TaxID=876091 RepID=UPI0026039F39|nr:glycerol-3-phosphate 1-O-acyltransferase PlsY [uncultured Oscillibacter sp.]